MSIENQLVDTNFRFRRGFLSLLIYVSRNVMSGAIVRFSSLSIVCTFDGDRQSQEPIVDDPRITQEMVPFYGARCLVVARARPWWNFRARPLVHGESACLVRCFMVARKLAFTLEHVAF